MNDGAGIVQDELVVLLDHDGRPCGVKPKSDVHGAQTPLHLAFSCYGFDTDDRLLVTRRADSKKTFPGLWTNTCCGHPAPGESVEDAIARRLAFELGLRPESLTLALPDFRYSARMNGVVENEVCPVYLCRVVAQPSPVPDEVSAFRWTAWSDYVAEAVRGAVSPWSRLQVAELERGHHVQSFLRR
jgi:isopentenyl-diphosphate Delta-isomerase